MGTSGFVKKTFLSQKRKRLWYILYGPNGFLNNNNNAVKHHTNIQADEIFCAKEHDQKSFKTGQNVYYAQQVLVLY